MFSHLRSTGRTFHGRECRRNFHCSVRKSFIIFRQGSLRRSASRLVDLMFETDDVVPGCKLVSSAMTLDWPSFSIPKGALGRRSIFGVHVDSGGQPWLQMIDASSSTGRHLVDADFIVLGSRTGTTSIRFHLQRVRAARLASPRFSLPSVTITNLRLYLQKSFRKFRC